MTILDMLQIGSASKHIAGFFALFYVLLQAFFLRLSTRRARKRASCSEPGGCRSSGSARAARSALSLRSYGRLGSALSVLDFVQLGSGLSLRAFARVGSAVRLYV